jgi:hypothetical protein
LINPQRLFLCFASSRCMIPGPTDFTATSQISSYKLDFAGQTKTAAYTHTMNPIPVCRSSFTQCSCLSVCIPKMLLLCCWAVTMLVQGDHPATTNAHEETRLQRFRGAGLIRFSRLKMHSIFQTRNTEAHTHTTHD